MKRRQFLQFTSSMLATLGISQLEIQRQSLRYAKTLAQNTPRKLALLIGINNYTNHSELRGCITDVELQKELLINRFGFNPADILLVTDETKIQPTRDNILTSFEEHIIKQAKPGDVVVVHYSGHGSRVVDKDKDEKDGLNGTFIPIDQTEVEQEKRKLVSDIMGHTLFLLMSAINTENITVVLDSCHSGGAKRGNLRVRALAREGTNSNWKYYPNNQELEYQQQWLSRLNMSEAEFKQKRKESVAKGIVIASAKRNQLAADAPFEGFFAGAFTYLMTQYLWQETGNQKVSSMLANVSRITTDYSFTSQIPELEAKKNTNNENQPTYLLEKPTPPAEAVVKEKQVKFWLGGANPESLVTFNKDAIFAWIDNTGAEKGKVQSTSRDGLLGYGKVIEGKTPQMGALLQERARSIPADLTLKIGLDDSLGNAATQVRGGLQQISRIEPLPIQQGEVHYILGKMTETLAKEAQQNNLSEVPEVGSFGLYTPGLELIPGSFGQGGETVESALQRLRPKLKSLLAARLVKLTLNADSSRLKVSAKMKTRNEEFVGSAFTVRGIGKAAGDEVATATPIKVEAGVPLLPVGTQVQLQVTNQEDRNLYMAVLVIDAGGEMGIVFPNTWVEGVDAALVKSGETKLLPQPGVDQFKLTVSKPLGNTEVLVIASVAPLRESLKMLQAIATARGMRSGPMSLEETDVVDSLLQDINAGSRGLTAEFDPTARVVDTTKIGAMSITFKAV